MSGRMFLPRVVLPWPERTLWPNAREHHMTVWRARKAQKAATHALALEAGLHLVSVPEAPIAVRLAFCPKTARSFDLDNAQAAMKAALDQIAAVIGVDDKWFRPQSVLGERSKTGGVIVTMEVLPVDDWQPISCVTARLVKETARKRGNAAGPDHNPNSHERERL